MGIKKDKIKFIKVSSELGAGTSGASKGFEGLKSADAMRESNLFSQHEIISIKDKNDSLLKNINFPTAKRIKDILEVVTNVSRTVKSQLLEKNFPIIIAGDHSIAIGTIAGIKSAYPSKNVGIIWVDAHADIHSPYTTPSGNVHGMPIAASLGLDHKLPFGNNPKKEVIKLWNDVKNLEEISPKIKPENIVYVGLRDTEWQEDKVLRELKIQKFSVDFVRRNGGKSTADTILNHLINTDIIYISFDVDVLDTSLSKGTGTPVPNGLFLREVVNLMKSLAKSPKLCCFEIVEINPTIDDKGNSMAEMGLDVLEEIISSIN